MKLGPAWGLGLCHGGMMDPPMLDGIWNLMIGSLAHGVDAHLAHHSFGAFLKCRTSPEAS